MNTKDFGLQLIGLWTLGLATTAQAALIDRGNGLIYDSDQDLTWLQDANYARTSGYDVDGRMTWYQAMAWADGLIFGGYDDWRLPTVVVQDDNWSDSGTDCGHNVNTSHSELAYMFHINLGNESYHNSDGSRNVDGCPTSSPQCLQHSSADGVDILNLQYGTYHLGTEFAPDIDQSWHFVTEGGAQGASHKDVEWYFAWAVRSGDVAAASVPEPRTLVLMLAGLAGIGAARRRS
jgi:hypothetical protein